MTLADPFSIVLGKDDLDGIVEDVAHQSDAIGSVEIVLQCSLHKESGAAVYYEDGLVLVICPVCGARTAQVEVAARARRWAREFND